MSRHDLLAADAVAPAEVKPAKARRRLRTTWSLRVGVIVLLFYIAVALLSLVWTPYDPLTPGVGDGYDAPSWAFLLGTDRLGSGGDRALSDHLLLPVFSIYTFVTWFQAGLAPRDFGPPGSGPREWRER